MMIIQKLVLDKSSTISNSKNCSQRIEIHESQVNLQFVMGFFESNHILIRSLMESRDFMDFTMDGQSFESCDHGYTTFLDDLFKLVLEKVFIYVISNFQDVEKVRGDSQVHLQNVMSQLIPKEGKYGRFWVKDKTNVW